jgi:hypothetical protein
MLITAMHCQHEPKLRSVRDGWRLLRLTRSVSYITMPLSHAEEAIDGISRYDRPALLMQRTMLLLELPRLLHRAFIVVMNTAVGISLQC